ncbi:MAG: hypothetical protein FD181_2249 [Prolixibacteraceae bacterium]|nr:MAG: hypothetical protein FD181_2249 [Prolixibacteraceae bacterium]
MKNYFLTFLFTVCLIGFSRAQLPLSYDIREKMDFYLANKFIEREFKGVLSEGEIDGSPYLNREFENGSIYTVQRQQYNEIPLRYNIYNDNLEFKTPDNQIMDLAAPEIVEKAVLGNNVLTYAPYLMANKTKTGFFLILEAGKASLFAKPEVVFQKATEPAAYKDAVPAKFVKNPDEYYIRIGSEQAVIISSKKDLIAAFPDNRDKIESFISRNKIKTNKPEGLKEVVKYYNTL